jgi:hypothetical protein
MLSFDIRSLEIKAVQVDGRFSLTIPFGKRECPASQPVRVVGRLSSAGEEDSISPVG